MPKNLEAPMLKTERTSAFETYVKDRNRRTSTALSAIEKAGTEAALDRCRTLAHRIQSDLSQKRPEHFVNVMSLADFQVSLERAASVLEHQNKAAFRIVPIEQDR